MRIDFSKEFAKAFDKLSGKIYESVRDAINNVIDAQSLDEIQTAKRLKPSTAFIGFVLGVSGHSLCYTLR